VDPPLILNLSALPRLHDDETGTLAISILSHFRPGLRVSLSLQSRLVEAARPAQAQALASLKPTRTSRPATS